MNDTTKASRAAAGSRTDSSLIDSDKVEGTHVFDPAGKHIGTIKRLVIEKVSGRVVYAVAQYRWLPRSRRQRVCDSLERARLRYEPRRLQNQHYRRSSLRNSPSFDGDGNDDYGYGDRDSEQELYDYYGAAYYWK